MKPKFKKGELAHHLILDRFGRVVGEEIVTITDIYSALNTRFGDYPELYEITNGEGVVTRGLLPHGLTKII